jgi:signal transduction histidine kinase
MADVLSLLLVEDSADDSALLVRQLQRLWPRIDHHRVQNAAQLQAALDDRPWDIVISDYSLPQFSGLAALALVRQKAGDLPFILVSGTVGEEIAVQAMKAGASDYLFKENLVRLAPAVEREIRDAAIRREARHTQVQLADAQRLARLGTWHRNFIDDSAVWSEETFRILGLSPPDPQSASAPKFRDFLSSIHPDDRPRLLKLLESPSIRGWAGDFRILLPDGQLRHICIRGDVLRDEGGHPTEATGTIQDITERKLAEQELAAAKEAAESASRAKDRFLAVLSHELRTPLTPVLAMVSSLQSRPDLSPELREELSAIRQNVETEARLIDELLDLTRIARSRIDLHFQSVDAHDAINKALNAIQSDAVAKSIRVSLQLTSSPARIWADPRRLRQILLNLLGNAVRFTPDAGTISISTTRERAGQLTIEIADSGIGIEPDVLARLFTPFEQGDHAPRPGGVGLGLAIAKGLVDLHHGSLTAASAGKNQGATLTLRLPLSPSEGAARLPPESAPAKPPPTRRRILLVEDHIDTLRVMSKLLRAYGQNVKTADTVQSAIACLDADPFDILISDIGLPDGTGLDVMRHAKSAQPSLKAIAVSGLGMEDDLRRSQEAGFHQHITKPVSIDKLLTAIDQLAAKTS